MQDISLRLIAEWILNFSANSMLFSSAPPPPAASGGGRSYHAPYHQTAYLQGEIAQQLEREPVVFSPPPLSVPRAEHSTTRRSSVAEAEHHESQPFHSYCCRHNTGVRIVALELQERFKTFRWTDDPGDIERCDHMLVLLNSRTWTSGVTSSAFARELRAAMRMGLHRQLVHEVPGARYGDNEARHTCPFEDFFEKGSTPGHLVKVS